MSYIYHNLEEAAQKNNTSWWFQIFFIFSPNLGDMIQFDDHIFQMGWFNHQLEQFFSSKVKFWLQSLLEQ